uniref:Membrane-associating domain n=1 Tax=Schistocephalus solidus TaxID=70667 RepID=A0A0V0J520_SCHSO
MVCNVEYLRSPSGILKILDLIFALICLICSSVHGAHSYAGYMLFAAVITLLYEIVMFANFFSGANTNFNLPWTLIDLICTLCLIVIDFIAFAVAAAYGYVPAYGGASFFFLGLIIFLGIEVYFQIIDLRKNGGHKQNQHAQPAADRTAPQTDYTFPQ